MTVEENRKLQQSVTEPSQLDHESTEAILQELRGNPKIKKTQKTIWCCHRDGKRELNQNI